MDNPDLDKINQNLLSVVRVPSDVSKNEVNAALKSLVTEFDSLRSSFAYTVSGEPVEVTNAPQDVEAEVLSGSRFSEESDVVDYVLDRNFPLNLPNRIYAGHWTPKGTGHEKVFLVVSHMAADGFAIGLITRRFAALLGGSGPRSVERRTDTPHLGKVPITAPNRSLAHWATELDSMAGRLFAQSKPKTRDEMVVRAEITSSDLRKLVVGLASEHGCSESTLLCAVYYSTLAAWTKLPRVTASIWHHQRIGAEQRAAVECLAQLLPLSVKSPSEFTTQSVLQQIIQGMDELRDCGPYRYDEMVEMAIRVGHQRGMPIHQSVSFNFLPSKFEQRVQDQIQVTEGPAAGSNFDLWFTVVWAENSLLLRTISPMVVLDRNASEAFLRGFCNTVQIMARGYSVGISDIFPSFEGHDLQASDNWRVVRGSWVDLSATRIAISGLRGVRSVDLTVSALGTLEARVGISPDGPTKPEIRARLLDLANNQPGIAIPELVIAVVVQPVRAIAVGSSHLETVGPGRNLALVSGAFEFATLRTVRTFDSSFVGNGGRVVQIPRFIEFIETSGSRAPLFYEVASTQSLESLASAIS